jgi:tetratricopeptide (TPR) repeat protein
MPPTSHHRPKINRKELKQPDELNTLAVSAIEFLNANLTQVLISAGIVVAVAGIAVGVYYYERHRDNLAAARFYTAITALNADQNKSAEEQFKKIADDEPGRRLGRLSRFYMATGYLNEGNLPAARDGFVNFLAEERDPLFTSLALNNLAITYEKMGDWKKAAGAYHQSAGIDGPEKVHAELGYARMLAKSGDKQAAIAAYQGFLAAHPFAEQRQDVTESLALLGAPSGPPSVSRSVSVTPATIPVVIH